MSKLFLLIVIGGVAVGAYNYSNGRDVFSLPGTSARALKNTVRETVGSTVREARAEVKEHASVGVHTAVNRAEEAVGSAALTSKIKAKMALDDVVKASDINVDTDGSLVTLTGTVASKEEQRRALRIATETAGVTKVVNHLKVR